MSGDQGFLTTHVLDTALGRPAAGIRITLFELAGDERRPLADAVTNADGRTDSPILKKGRFRAGVYELIFHAGPYLAQTAGATASGTAGPRFLDDVPIRFGIDDPDAHYHVPLLLSPYGYATYRGS